MISVPLISDSLLTVLPELGVLFRVNSSLKTLQGEQRLFFVSGFSLNFPPLQNPEYGGIL